MYIKLKNTGVIIPALAALFFLQTGCTTPTAYRKGADDEAFRIIREKQEAALGKAGKFSIERPSDILRRRLIVDQNLPFASEDTLGSDTLKKIEHWPEESYPGMILADPLGPDAPLKGIPLTLLHSLQVGALNSPDYQTRKEDLFKAALDLDLRREDFDFFFKGRLEGQGQSNLSGREGVTVLRDDVTGFRDSDSLSVSKTLQSGAKVITTLAVDLVKLLTQNRSSSFGITGDASISIPLLRGSGRHIVTEPLTQAERNMVYAVYDFERFKKTFAVSIATSYLEVLRSLDQAENAADNYRTLIFSARRLRRLADAGRAKEIDVDQAFQNELRARNRWITAVELYKSRLDAFKKLLGLSPDAEISLDKRDLDQLLEPSRKMMEDLARSERAGTEKDTPPADAPITLVEPGYENAGPLEMEGLLAIELGLENRLDLRTALGKIYDAQRKVVVAADALGAELTLFGSVKLGEARTLTTASLEDAKLRAGKGIYSALLTLDLPLERTAERNAYRNSFIALERAVREAQKLEDEIKLSLRDELGNMRESRESLRIQSRAVALAERRMSGANLLLEAGRGQVRDLLDAQEALITAKNALTSAAVAYRTAEWGFQRDAELLEIEESGLWREYRREASGNGKKE